jgi:phosphoribosylaminoimidazole-succinocarboxamide synthase
MSAAIFAYLEGHGVPTHFVEQVDDTSIKTKRLTMLPVEVVVRNVAAGSLSRLLGFEEGRKLKAPIVELCYKDDELGDPLLNWYHFRELGVSDEDLKFCEGLGLKVNEILAPFFDERGITLVDFKIEVGRDENGHLPLLG